MEANHKPRILIFSLAYFPSIGGAEVAVKEITDRLADRFDFDLVTHKFNKSWPGLERVGPVFVYRISSSSKFLYIFKAWFLARKLNKDRHYSVIWSIMAAYAGASALLFKISNPKIPFLLTLQEGDSERHILKRVGIFYPIWKFIFKKADYVQAISNYLADFARRHGAKCPVEVVPNGVDLEAYRSNRSYRINTIITTSRLVYKNGIDVLIRAAAELKKPSFEFKVLIVGDGPERENLEKLAKNLDLSSEVIFIGHIEPDKIPECLYQADIFVRPSRSEGLGNSFLEAMAAGLPVIGTPVGGIPDFLKDGETGVFCGVDDYKDLADKINLVLSDEDLYGKLSSNGINLVRQKYAWDDISARMGKILEKL